MIDKIINKSISRRNFVRGLTAGLIGLTTMNFDVEVIANRVVPLPLGYWKDWENVEREVREAIEKNNGEMPLKKWLEKNGYSGLVDAAYNHYDGLPNIFDRVMGAEPDKLELFLKGYAEGV